MRIISSLIVFIFFLFSLNSCNELGFSTIKGEGKIVKTEIPQSAFNQIEINCEADLLIKYGETQKITVYGQQNIIDKLHFKTFNNLCNIGFAEGHYSYESLTIEIILPDIHRVSLIGSGNIVINDFKKIDQFVAEITGSGDIAFNADSASIESIKTDIAGSGNFSISKPAICKKLFVDITGSGEIHCFALNTQNANIDISGSGDCEVNVSKNLTIDIAGSGDVHYKGQPVINQSITGAGTIKHTE